MRSIVVTRAYSVTISVAGFKTVKRDGIELIGTFVAAVNADLAVGALEETVTSAVNHRPSSKACWCSRR